MKVDILLETSGDYAADASAIKRFEDYGFETAWITETHHNPFFPLTVAAGRTTAIRLGTFGAAALPRSPMVSAQIAWDLARQSGGRFDLGLQLNSPADDVKDSKDDDHDRVSRAREYIESLGAIWNTFQLGERLRYRGRHYQFRLMAPFFNPGPITVPEIPISLYADQPGLFELAGELCHGLHLPVLHGETYLRDVALPEVGRALHTAGRDRRDISIVAPVMIASGRTRQEMECAKQASKARIARLARENYAGIPMEYSGWTNIFNGLRKEPSAAAQREGWPRVSDDMLRQLAIVAEPDGIADALRARYEGLADRVAIWWDAQDPKLLLRIMRSFGE